jgi:membrane protein implicated in regulation of membrane protease activity
VAHSVSQAAVVPSAEVDEPTVGSLVQSAMADLSTLVRGEIELAKAEVGKSAKKAGVSVGLFGAAGVLAAFAGVFFFIALAEFLTWLGLTRWISYLIVFALLLLIAGMAALIGNRMLKRIEKPERTLETLRELPEVAHREAPGARHRDVPTVANGRVALRGNDNYKV